MTYRKVKTWPARCILNRCVDIDKFDEVLQELVVDMIDTCNVDNGIGLAANQIGVNKRVVVIKPSAFGFDNGDPSEYNEEWMILVNPKLKNSGDMATWHEACLSLPGVEGKVARHSETVVEYQNLVGETKALVAEWPLSGGLQHECDHLEGQLFISKMSRGARYMVMDKYTKKQKKQQRAERKALREKAQLRMPKPKTKRKKRRKK